MAQSKATKRLFNMAYGIGAAIVILGALFKIMHFQVDFGPAPPQLKTIKTDKNLHDIFVKLHFPLGGG